MLQNLSFIFFLLQHSILTLNDNFLISSCCFIKILIFNITCMYVVRSNNICCTTKKVFAFNKNLLTKIFGNIIYYKFLIMIIGELG